MQKPSEQFRARGLSGWYVIMVLDKQGRPIPGVRAHGASCTVMDHDYAIGPDSPRGDFGPVPVEEVPAGTKPCHFCGGGSLKRWLAGDRPR
jgi:hypothetical protein